MNISRTILHYQDATSDKVYIVEVSKLTGAKPFVVMTTWGKRTAPRLSSQIKDTFTAEYQAIACARKLVEDKRRGKSAYKLAISGLVIPGFVNHTEVNAGHVVQAAKTAAPKQTEIHLVDDSDFKRSIKI